MAPASGPHQTASQRRKAKERLSGSGHVRRQQGRDSPGHPRRAEPAYDVVCRTCCEVHRAEQGPSVLPLPRAQYAARAAARQRQVPRQDRARALRRCDRRDRLVSRPGYGRAQADRAGKQDLGDLHLGQRPVAELR